jgi:hypothetical protein
MAYLGRGLDRGNYLKLDDLASQFDGSTVTFNLTSGGQAFFPGSAFSILVSLAGIIQEPESAYIITNNTITFASPPQGGDDYFCIALGVPLAAGTVPVGSVNSTHLQTGVVTSEKIAGAAVTTSKIDDAAVTFEKLDPDARGVGIQSGGISIAGAGITQLNFVGTGNTFVYNSSTKTVDISIEGGGGGGAAGIATAVDSIDDETIIVGIGTTVAVGSAHSEGVLQVDGNVAIVEGALLTDQNIDIQVNVPTGKNALLIGPVTVGNLGTIDVALGSVLVVV